MVSKICAPFFRLNFGRLALLCRNRIIETLQSRANGVILKVEDCTNTPLKGRGQSSLSRGPPTQTLRHSTMKAQEPAMEMSLWAPTYRSGVARAGGGKGTFTALG